MLSVPFFGDSLTIEYLPDGASAGEAVPFQIVAISHIWDGAFEGGVEGGVRWPEAALGSSDRRGAVKPLPDRIDVAAGTQLKKSRLTKAMPSVERSVPLQQPTVETIRLPRCNVVDCRELAGFRSPLHTEGHIPAEYVHCRGFL